MFQDLPAEARYFRQYAVWLFWATVSSEEDWRFGMVVSKFFLLKSESQARFETRWANLNPDRFGSVRGIIHDPQHRPIQGAMVMLKSRSSDWAKSDAKRRGFLQCRAPRRLFNQRGEPRLCSVSAEPGRKFGHGTRNAFSAECGGSERDTDGTRTRSPRGERQGR
jgi:hypothetical protein